MNIVEKASGTPPDIKGNPGSALEDSITVKNLFQEFENHPSIINIKNQNLAKRSCEIYFAKTNQTNKMIKEVDLKKTCGPDKIPCKIVKLSGNVIDCLTNIIIGDIKKNSFQNVVKLHLSDIFLKNYIL